MKRIFIIPILIFASAMLLIYFVLPQYSAQKTAKENFLKREIDVKNRQDYLNGLKSTLLEVSTYQETIEKIELSMPGEISLVSLIDFLDQKASNNGLILKLITPTSALSSEESPANLIETPSQSFSLSLSGGISSFEGFLKDLETSSKLVSVETFSIQQEKGSSSLAISMQIKVYY